MAGTCSLQVSVRIKERGVLPTDRSFVWRLGFPALTPHRRAGSCLTDPDHHSSGCNGTTRCLPCATTSGGSIATGLRPAPLWTGVTPLLHAPEPPRTSAKPPRAEHSGSNDLAQPTN